MDENKETPIEKVAKTPLPEPLTSSEKHTFEARIAELENENEELRAALENSQKQELPKSGEGFNLDEWVPKIF